MDSRANICYNQYGYTPDAPKFACIQQDIPGPFDWMLTDAQTGTVQAQGTTLPPFRDPLSGTVLHRADFSGFSKPGVYTISIMGIQSGNFRIGKNIYGQLQEDSLKFFYLMRSGIELSEELAGKTWARPAGHLSDADIRAFAGTDAQGTLWKGLPWPIDGSGGWYDAGDFGKYVVNGGISVWTLQNAYELAPHYFLDGSQNIPGILDECRWELEFLLRMQITEGHSLSGMVFHKLHDRKWSNVPTTLPTTMNNNNEMKDGAAWGRFVYEPSTAATLNMAAAAAQAARLWISYDKRFAEKCLHAAETAWQAAAAQPNLLAGNVPGEGGGNYDDTNVQDEFYWAACELYATTGNVEYETYIRSSPYFQTFPGLLDNSPTSMSWADTAALGNISLALCKTDLPRTDRDRIQDLIVQTAERYAAIQNSNGFAIPMDKSGFVWGSNSVVLNVVVNI